MNTLKETPIFMAPANGSIATRHLPWIEKMNRQDPDSLYIEISNYDIVTGNVKPAYEHLMALQHYPQLAEKALLSISLRFVNTTGKAWLDTPATYMNSDTFKWLCRLVHIFKPGLFFLKDQQARLLGIIGDLLHPHQRDAVISGNLFHAALHNTDVSKVDSRLLQAAISLELYFYGSGINVRSYIERVLEEFQSAISYEQVHSRMEAHLKANAWLQAKNSATSKILEEKKGKLPFIPADRNNQDFYLCPDIPAELTAYVLPETLKTCWRGREGVVLYQELPNTKFPASHQIMELERETIFIFPFGNVKNLLIFSLGNTLPIQIGSTTLNVNSEEPNILRGHQLINLPVIFPPGKHQILCIDVSEMNLSQASTSHADIIKLLLAGRDLIRSVLQHFKK